MSEKTFSCHTWAVRQVYHGYLLVSWFLTEARMLSALGRHINWKFMEIVQVVSVGIIDPDFRFCCIVFGVVTLAIIMGSLQHAWHQNWTKPPVFRNVCLTVGTTSIKGRGLRKARGNSSSFIVRPEKWGGSEHNTTLQVVLKIKKQKIPAALHLCNRWLRVWALYVI